METQVQVDSGLLATDNGLIANGSVAQRLLSTGGNYDALRPYVGEDGKSYISVHNGKYDSNGKPLYEAKFIGNAGAVLSKNEWQYLDSAVVRVAKPRLQLVNAMRAAGMTESFANAYNFGVYQYERVGDIDQASVSMSPKSRSTIDRPTTDIVNLPLPIVHKELSFEARELAISRNRGQAISTTALELASERVAETIEKMALGTWGTYAYGGGTLYGLTNFPGRQTGAFLNPTVGGWTPQMLYNSVIEMVKKQQDQNQFGTYDLYFSTGLMQYMLRDYSANYAGSNLQNKIAELSVINSVQQLDYLTGNQLVLVRRSAQTASILVGMDMRLVQWNTDGGETLNMRLMALMVPLIRQDQSSQSGIVHYTGNATTV